jgi:hypothetical protein
VFWNIIPLALEPNLVRAASISTGSLAVARIADNSITNSRLQALQQQKLTGVLAVAKTVEQGQQVDRLRNLLQHTANGSRQNSGAGDQCL